MYELEKIKHIKENSDKINKLNKDDTLLNNKDIIDLLHIKERLNKKININNKKLIDYKNNIVYEKTNEYSVGDKIKYKLFNEETGEIVKIYKTNGKIKVKNSSNKNVDIPKTLVLSVIKHFDINDIENELCKLNDEIANTDKLINEIRQQELLRLTTELNDEIKLYNKETNYVLFNILTNEYINVKCDFQK